MIQNFRANDTNIFGQTPWGQTRIDQLNMAEKKSAKTREAGRFHKGIRQKCHVL